MVTIATTTAPESREDALMRLAAISTPITGACSECAGLGEIQDLEVRQHGRFVMQWAPCETCHGAGTITVAA